MLATLILWSPTISTVLWTYFLGQLLTNQGALHSYPRNPEELTLNVSPLKGRIFH